jgi:hypothetical protein
MAEVKMRLNLNAMEVELVVDGAVALSSGKDVFLSWVEAANKLNPPVHSEPVKVEAPVPATPVSVEVPVNENVIESPTLETSVPAESTPEEVPATS